MTFDAAHIHLMLNHLPVVAAPLLVLLLTVGLLRNSRELVTVSLVLAAGLALVTGMVYVTGEPAEELVERAPWFPETLADAHEEHAEIALVAMLATGALAAAGIAVRARPGAGARLARLTWAGLVVSTLLLGWTAWSGGQIRHDEVRTHPTGP
jgi:hypothetical protein